MQLLIDSVQDTVGRVSLLKKTDVGRNTALHYAAECGNQDIIKTILSSIPLETAKILIELQNQCNQNIYDIAVQQESEDTIAYLDRLLRQHAISREQDQGKFTRYNIFYMGFKEGVQIARSLGGLPCVCFESHHYCKYAISI